MPELDPASNPLSRVELLRLAQGLGVVDADVMTRAELRAAIDKAQRPERPSPEPHPVTWVSVARRLLASVVERGLNLPDAAALIRGDAKLMSPPKAPPPVATVTLARIYAAQGHLDRAIGTLDEVLQSDPDHELARDLREQLAVRRAELAPREGEAGPPSAELDATSQIGAPPASDDSLTPHPPPVAKVDASAELVAPSFDTIERQTLDSPTFPAQTLDSHTFPAQTLQAELAVSDFPQFPTEPPTLVGVVPPEAPSSSDADAVRESESPVTLAAGIDWQIENDDEARALSDTSESTAAPASVDAPSGAADGTSAAAAEVEAPRADVIVRRDDTAPAAPSADEALDSPPSAGGGHASNGVANGIAALTPSIPEPPAPDAAEAPAQLPSVPGLLLIETDTPVRYIYWELAAAGSATPHWIHVVSHTPTGHGDTERRERRFPVHRQLGAVRLEGVPRQAVVRARLTHAPDDARALVVAGAVRPRALEGSEAFEVRYAPHAKAMPEALAGRARSVLDRASPIYWDS